MQKKFLICSDFLMTKKSEQLSNLKWLNELIENKLMSIKTTNTYKIELLTLEDSNTGYNRKVFFDHSDIQLDSNTQFYFDSEKITDKSLSYLYQFIFKDEIENFSAEEISLDIIIIGYELSKQTKSILDKLNIKYIDIWLHSVRFIDDILFGMYSNDKDIYEGISSSFLNDEIIYNEALVKKISSYKGWRRTAHLNIEKGSCVFFGQTLTDKSVLDNGKFLNILDFKQKISDILKSHSKMYYVRHPYLKTGDEKILKYIENHPKIELCTYDSYALLSHDNIKTVIALSSSLVLEAKYFGKETIYLFRPIVEYGINHEYQHYITIYQDIISTYFWSKILFPFDNTIEVPESKYTFLSSKDKLRDMLGFYWSYKQIDKLENLRSFSMFWGNKVQNLSQNLSQNKLLNKIRAFIKK